MTQQIRRAALSSASQYCRGFCRRLAGERKRFFEISRSSLVEVDTALNIAVALEYSNTNELEEMGNAIVHCFKQLSALIAHTPIPDNQQ